MTATFTGPFNLYSAATSVAPLNGGSQAIANANPGCADFLGPYEYNGALYVVIQTIGSAVEPSLVYMQKSIDGGATWSVLDSANSPVRSSGLTQGDTTAGVYRDGTSIWVCYSPNNGGAFTGAPIRLKAFDLTTEVWGTVSANGPGAVVINCLFKRSDGTFIVVHNNNSSSGTLMFSVYTPGSDTWSAATDATSLWGGLTSNNAAACVLDSSDVLHMICPAKTAAVTDRWIYQQITLAGTLQNFLEFSTSLFSAFNPNAINAFCAKPVIVGTKILFGVYDATGTFPVCLIGDGISGAPSWSVSGTMDPTYDLRRPTPFALCYNPLDSVVYGAAGDSNSGFTQGEVRLVSCPVSDLSAGWALVQSFNVTVNGDAIQTQFATPFPAAAGLLPYIFYQADPPDTTGGFSSIQTSYLYIPGSSPAIEQTTIITLYGYKLTPVSRCADALVPAPVMPRKRPRTL